MGGDNAGGFGTVLGMNGGSVLDRIQLALRFHRVSDALIFVHADRLNPRHPCLLPSYKTLIRSPTTRAKSAQPSPPARLNSHLSDFARAGAAACFGFAGASGTEMCSGIGCRPVFSSGCACRYGPG